MRTAMIVAISALLGACGGGGGDSGQATAAAPATAASAPTAPAPTGTQSPLPSQLEMARLLYTDSQRTPVGFLQAQAAPEYGYEATLHLRQIDATDPSRPGAELCTDDWNEALAWSEDEAGRNTGLGSLVETNTTDRYFEFVRISNVSLDTVTRIRVFRCAYLDRQGVDPLAPEGFAGLFNAAQAGSEDLRELAEYLWSFTANNNFGTVVLESSGAPVKDGLEHTLTMARLTRSTGTACDDVEILLWRHTFDTGTAALTLETESLPGFKARQVGTHVEVCQS